ncbi:hypothetical protein T492DRAFT_989920 [Pavlovales sp. CCMP2436]|nr:hypothetical protein T492DRAFT_989920 [Pavlovales sp. CCMP2436]|mmetsp:Transcript_6324/g.15134  ORF Transcript_6324/g.15134 Transcript_6324/m.15134 type:complete len:259 (-) Transcript_6324:221-997(-)
MAEGVPCDDGFTQNDWTSFNDVKAAMAERELELSTDEEDGIQPPDRQSLLRAADERLKREDENPNPPAQVGEVSFTFNARADGVFGALGGPVAGLRFWTSIHAEGGSLPAAGSPGSPESPGGGDELEVEREWDPMDDLESLSDGAEKSDLEGAEKLRTGKRTREPLQPRAAAEGEQRGKVRATAQVTFGADTIHILPSADDEDEGAEDPTEPRAERKGYQHYSLEDVDADARTNRAAADTALAAVAMQHAATIGQQPT